MRIVETYKMAFVISTALILTGCLAGEQDGESVESVPVNGILTYKGKPLPAEYQIIFFPVEGKRAAMGKTDDNGRFTMGTNETGDGAPPGKSNIAITFVPEIVGEDGKEDLSRSTMPPPIKLPRKYSDPKMSGLSVDVPPEGLTDYKIELK